MYLYINSKISHLGGFWSYLGRVKIRLEFRNKSVKSSNKWSSWKKFWFDQGRNNMGENLALLLFSKTVILRLLIINPGSCWSRLKWQITRHRQVGNRGFETRCWHDTWHNASEKCTFFPIKYFDWFFQIEKSRRRSLRRLCATDLSTQLK